MITSECGRNLDSLAHSDVSTVASRKADTAVVNPVRLRAPKAVQLTEGLSRPMARRCSLCANSTLIADSFLAKPCCVSTMPVGAGQVRPVAVASDDGSN